MIFGGLFRRLVREGDWRQREQIEQSSDRLMADVTRNLHATVAENTHKTDIYTGLIEQMRQREQITA